MPKITKADLEEELKELKEKLAVQYRIEQDLEFKLKEREKQMGVLESIMVTKDEKIAELISANAEDCRRHRRVRDNSEKLLRAVFNTGVAIVLEK